MSSEHKTDAPRWAYTAPDGPHGHWQITDEHGAIHACPHQPPSDELLAALLSPAPGSTSDPGPEPTPAPRDAPTPQPAPMPQPPPVWSTATGDQPAPAETGRDDPAYWSAQARWDRLPAGSPLSVLPAVREVMAGIQLSEDQLRLTVREPARVEISENATVACHRGNVRVIMAPDGTALHVQRQHHDLPPAPKPVGRRAGSGPAPAPTPTNRNELLKLLHAHGFIVTRGGKHETVMHPTLPGRVTLPLTPSDTRWIHNCLSEIRSRFDIDLRQRG